MKIIAPLLTPIVTIFGAFSSLDVAVANFAKKFDAMFKIFVAFYNGGVYAAFALGTCFRG